jgi:hypothetical protein
LGHRSLGSLRLPTCHKGTTLVRFKGQKLPIHIGLRSLFGLLDMIIIIINQRKSKEKESVARHDECLSEQETLESVMAGVVHCCLVGWVRVERENFVSKVEIDE